MNYLTMAKIEIAGKPYIVCDCRLLENDAAYTLKTIKSLKNVNSVKRENCLVMNPSDEFISDLDKILNKISKGEEARYYQGDFSKYYITDYSKVMEMFEWMWFKSL